MDVLKSESVSEYESLFLLHLFRVLAEDRNKIDLHKVLREQANAIKRHYAALGVDAMCMWGRIYRSLQMEQEETECLEEAKSKKLVNVADLRVLIPLIETENPDRALKLFQDWLLLEPENGTLRVAYLEFISRNADHFPGEVEELINQTKAWLKDAGALWDSTQAYIKFIISHSPEATPLRLDSIATTLCQWLRNNIMSIQTLQVCGSHI